LPRSIAAIPFEQKLGAQAPLDAGFRDETGTDVTIGSLLQGKPAVLVLGYQRCPRLCSLVLANLVASLKKVTPTVGDDFSVIDVSIDPFEDPEMGREAKKTALERYGRGSAAGWHFLIGKELEIRRLASAVGFTYRKDRDRLEPLQPVSVVYQHPSGIILLTPDGKVARYLFGVDFTPRDLELGLVESSQGKIGTPVANVLLLTCMAYDPATGRYTPTALLLMRAAALATIVGLAGFFAVGAWRSRRLRLPSPPLRGRGVGGEGGSIRTTGSCPPAQPDPLTPALSPEARERGRL
jgi:protein SCO1/2